jgi:hypothetical protein
MLSLATSRTCKYGFRGIRRMGGHRAWGLTRITSSTLHPDIKADMPCGQKDYLKILDSTRGYRRRRSFDRQSTTTQLNEQSKRAIHSDLDWVELCIHLLGLAATSVVIGLHAANHYWVDLGYDGSLSINATLKYLQVTAKLHEMAMMASISYVLLFLINRRLIQSGVPFGQLDAPYIIGAGGGIGLLVTKRFWSPWRQHLLVSFILLFSVLLTLALNPASAVAMIPSLAYWPVHNPYGLGTCPIYKHAISSIANSSPCLPYKHHVRHCSSFPPIYI